jgi:Xaa-Pro dipeptidase
MSKIGNSIYSSRVKKLSQFLTKRQAILISTPADIVYLTGFKHLVPEERESFLLVTSNSNHFLHASFAPFGNQGGINSIKGCSLEQLSQVIQQLIAQKGLEQLLVDKTSLFVVEYEALSSLPLLEIADFDRDQIWQLRTIKDEMEIKTLKKAARITSQVMKETHKSLEVGVTELQLKKNIEKKFKQAGCERSAFPTIVAFGNHSALPHHQPTSLALKENMPVLIDLGAMVDQYCGDMTRTVWFGDKPDPEFLLIEKIVKQAYQKTFAQLKTRSPKKMILAKDLDQTARDVINLAGFGENFIHTTGHGLGISLHETLSLNWKNEQPILPGMVITIEPGIYLESKFGFRYENTILISQNSAQKLTV